MQDTANHDANVDQALYADLNAASEAIWARSYAQHPGLSVEVLREVGSTNTALMARARTPDVGPTLLTAVRQTAGRGRQGRVWQAQAGQCLTFSLGLPMRLEHIPGGGSALSLAVGLALAQSIDAACQQLGLTAPLTQLKWPNDLWWQQRKLGGVLIEATASPHLPPDQRWVVIGVGLNITPATDLPQSASLSEAWTSDRPPLRPGQVWTWVASELLDAVRRFETTGFTPLQAAYEARDVLQNQSVYLWTHAHAQPGVDAPQQHGRAVGVNQQGGLLVHTDEQIQTWTTGDVTVRLTSN